MKGIFTALVVLCAAICFISCDGSVEGRYKGFEDEINSCRLEIDKLQKEELEVKLEYYEYVASLDDEEFEEWADNNEAWAEEVYEEFEEQYEELEERQKEINEQSQELRKENPGLI